MQSTFKGKTIVISGIARGIGRCLALQCAQLGMQVAGVDVKEEELNTLKRELDELGVTHFLDIVDIRNGSECQQYIENCIEKLGVIDILINNAGITHIAPEHETSIEQAKNVIDINFMGSVYLSHYALPYIIKQKGTIAGVSSVAGYSPLMYRTAYAASKHAVWGYLSTLRSEIREKGVQVLIICPSYVVTNIQDSQQKYFVSNANVALTPEYVASEILRAIRKNLDVVFIGKTAKQVYWLNKFFPKLYERIMVLKTRKDN